MNNSKIYCASVGDSRAIIVYEQEANGSSEENMNSFVQGDNRIFTIVQLSTDHKIERSDEAERIQACGGEIGRINGKGPLRIWKPGNNFPGLSMTRSFGDKVAHTLGVIATPEIYCYQMTRRERILVLGSDGLWEFMSNL
jgi:serine/threonine protein phosphatase PrpC